MLFHKMLGHTFSFYLKLNLFVFYKILCHHYHDSKSHQFFARSFVYHIRNQENFHLLLDALITRDWLHLIGHSRSFCEVLQSDAQITWRP